MTTIITCNSCLNRKKSSIECIHRQCEYGEDECFEPRGTLAIDDEHTLPTSTSRQEHLPTYVGINETEAVAKPPRSVAEGRGG